MTRYNDAMRSAILEQTAASPELIGYALDQHRLARHLTVEEQAMQLGVGVDDLVRLSLCKLPRPRHYQKDLAAVCRLGRMNVEVLTDTLRA